MPLAKAKADKKPSREAEPTLFRFLALPPHLQHLLQYLSFSVLLFNGGRNVT